ncbi:MAG: PilZ domain-containing protein [Acidobacteriota bacterium]
MTSTTIHSAATPPRRANRRARALAIGLDAAEYQAVAPLISDQVEVDRFPSPRGALDLIVPMAVDLLLVRYPLSDMRLPDFLHELRCPDAHSSRCSLMLITSGEHLEAARDFLGRGANRVVTLEQSDLELYAAVTDLLRVAPRKEAHFVAQLQAGSGRSMDYVVGAVRNTSATGALVETERKLPRGVQVRFHFSLPTGAVVGIGEVVRHTSKEHEAVDGIGLRFLSFDGDSQHAFLRYLADADDIAANDGATAEP